MSSIMKQKSKQRVISIIMVIAMVITSLQLGTTTVSAATGSSFASCFKEGDLNLKEAYIESNLGTGKSIIGQVTYKYGTNIILQDEIGGEVVGFVVYDNKNTYNIGDVVRVKGTIKNYNNLIEMDSVVAGSVEVLDTKTAMKAQEVTIDQLKKNPNDYISEYVVIKAATLGTYLSTGNTPLTDATGTINGFKLASYATVAKEGDVVDFYGVLTVFKTDYQMKNNASSDYIPYGPTIDTSVNVEVASWTGTATPAGITIVNADKGATGSSIVCSDGGKLTNGTGAYESKICLNNWTMDKYYEISTTSKGVGNLTLNYTMRSTKAAPGEFKVLYKADDKEWVTLDKTYSFPILTATSNQEFSVTLPEGANNAETLLIRLQPASTKTAGGGATFTPSASSTNYLFEISLNGNPMDGPGIVSVAKADPVSGAVASGTSITLTSKSSTATIYYQYNDREVQAYDPANKPVFDELPAKVVTYAKSGTNESFKMVYNYTQAQVATVKINPSSMSVTKGTSLQLSCETEGAVISYSLDNGANWILYDKSNLYKLETFPINVSVKASKEGYTDSAVKSVTYIERLNENYNNYFGQIHSHTDISDGTGSLDDAYKYASQENKNIDFLAVTDHSHYFDEKGNESKVSLKNGTASANWMNAHTVADNYTNDKFVAIYGFEMTWSGQPGHMNTYNTNGFLDRTMSTYSTGRTGLQSYYTALKEVPNSISQFNHPGTTFGDFFNFAYYDPEIDKLVNLIEVGNGEGAIGSSGYFPSYEYYTRALDKGWHVAPTNNQDNHKGKWGDANTARTVILADTLTRDSVYDAMQNMRVYATEDQDLKIQYKLNGCDMGTIIADKPTEVNIKANLADPTDNEETKVEVICNGGVVAGTKTLANGNGDIEFVLNADYAYYYLRITQADGNIAVTAPVWISEVEAVGLSGMSTSTILPLKDQEIEVTTGFFNNEKDSLLINSVDYYIGDQKINSIDLTDSNNANIKELKSESEASYSFKFKYSGVGKIEVVAKVKATLAGNERAYSDKLALEVIDSKMTSKIVVDAGHTNAYVDGNYKDSMGNFAVIAAQESMQTIIEKEITADTLKDCSLLIISAPDLDTGKRFEDEFIATVKDYVDRGGSIIICGITNYKDNDKLQRSTEINKLLKGIGATTKVNSDQLEDNTTNGGQPQRLYLTNLNKDAAVMSGVVDGQVYSAYRSCGVLPNADAVASGKTEVLVRGHATTESIDRSTGKEKLRVEVAPGESINLVCETVGPKNADVFVAGTVFMSNFEVKVEMDNANDLQYANKNIIVNILKKNKKDIAITSIAEMRKGKLGEAFAIEGYVTSSSNNFEGALYVQDNTAGTIVFPITQEGIKIGQKIRIEGYVDEYQGDKELQVKSFKLLEGNKVYAPTVLTTAQAANYDKFGGLLATVTGTVTEVNNNESTNKIETIKVKDSSGVEAIIFLDGYIKASGEDVINNIVKVGAEITSTGFVYSHPATGGSKNETVLRVRDRSEIIPAYVYSGPAGGTVKPTPSKPEVPSKVEAVKTEISTKPVTATEKNGMFYSEDGKKITEAMVKTKSGEKYIVDEKGEKYVSSMVSTKDGNKYIVNDEGSVVTGKIVETNGNKYYTTKATGKVVTNKIIKIEKTKYYATKTGAFAIGKIVSVDGDLYYTTKNTGKIVANKLVKIEGKKYFATKTGKLAISKWVTVDDKKYYCNKDGIITKTK